MSRDEFINYLTSNSCVVVRNDKNKGYSVVRNVISGKISGIPKESEMLNATICRICKSLVIDPPEDAKDAQHIVDLAHKNHGPKDNEGS